MKYPVRRDRLGIATTLLPLGLMGGLAIVLLWFSQLR